MVAITANLMVFPETATRMDNIIFTLVNIDHWFNNNVSHAGSASGEFQMIKRTAFEAMHGYQKHLAVAEGNAEEACASDASVALFGDGDSIVVTTAEQPVRFLLCSARPLHEPVAWGGPIVMNTQAELQAAFDELERGTFIREGADKR